MTAALALSDAELDTMRGLHRAGHSLRDIGQQTGRHHTTVHAAIGKRGNRGPRDGFADVRMLRAAAARSKRIGRHERLRLLGLDDDILLDARDYCLLHGAPNTAILAAAVPGLSENMARLWLRVFWWVARPVSLRAKA